MSNPIKTLDYFSPNLRGEELYKFFSVLMDRGLDKFYYPEMDKMQQLYTPGAPGYDANYIIELLGGTNLSNLISKLQDATSVSVLLPGIYDLKGTQEGLETILKLIKLDYQNIVYLRDRSGDTKVTIILRSGAAADIADLKLLEQLATEMLPVCLSLDGITNCDAVKDSMNQTGDKWTADIGLHTISTSFRLDNSVLGRSQGFIPPGSSTAILLCSTGAGDVWINENGDLPSVEGLAIRTSISELYALQDEWYLSRTLFLSRQSPENVIGVTASGGRSQIDVLDLATEFDVTSRSQSFCYGVFVPGYSIMGRDANRLSHNATRRITNEALDDGKLSRTTMLSRNTVTTLKVCATRDNHWKEEIDISAASETMDATGSALRTKGSDVYVDPVYDPADYNDDYLNDGILGQVTGSVLRTSSLDLENDFFSSMEMSGYSTRVSSQDPAYDTEIDVITIHESRGDSGLYTQYSYNELDYKV